MSGRLEALAVRAAETKAMPHNAAIAALRTFIKTQGEEVIVKQITLIEDARAFNSLFEAGLSRRLQDAAMARWQSLPPGGP